MKAKDKNNKTLKEADWVSYNNRIYQIDCIYKNPIIGTTVAILWFQYVKNSKKVKCLHRSLNINVKALIKVDPPLAYNITDYE